MKRIADKNIFCGFLQILYAILLNVYITLEATEIYEHNC